jgi:Leucine-rich repeat (LRR) protein
MTKEVSNICGRSGTMYTCRNSHLTSIPRNVPSHVIAIDASGNNITTLHDNSFRGLGNLRAIYLERNKIHHIQRSAFKDLPHLCVLDLYKNRLTNESVDPAVLKICIQFKTSSLRLTVLMGDFRMKR